jgi:tetratricopeptide (TPR) repeat protein
MNNILQNITVLILGSILLIAGCSHTPPRPLPAVIEQALTNNRDGIAFEQRGDSRRARKAFSESLRQSAAVEYTAGIVAAQVSLARLDRRAGDLASATRRIEQARAQVDSNDPLRFDVAFEAALIALANKDIPTARRAAEDAITAATAAQKGPALALHARTLAADGEVNAARQQAELALNRNRTEHHLAEAANAARLLGDLALGRDDLAAAESYYQQALDFDHQAALSHRIADDLRRLSTLSQQRQDIANAIAYRQRASDVSLNNYELTDAAADLALLAELYRSQGDDERAATAEALRQRLLTPAPTR